MASLTIEGIPKPVDVDPSFADLSPDEQAKVVTEIKTAWERRQAPQRDTSFTGALGQGVSNVVEGLSNTARIAGGDRAVRPEQSTGSYDPAMPQVVEGVRNLDRRAIDYLPRAVVENLPDLGGAIAAGGAGALVGGPIGGLVGAGLYGAARMFGDTAEQRARNDNRQSISGGDLGVAGATAAAGGALEAVGTRGLRTLLPAALQGGRSLLRRITGRTAGEAATETGQSVTQQVGETAGTERGLTVDPAQAAAEGLVGGASRFATSAPVEATGAAVRAGRETAATAALGLDDNRGGTPEERLASVERVNRIRDQYAAQNVPLEDVFNSARVNIKVDIHNLLEDARDNGWLGNPEDARQSYRSLKTLFDTAVDHNKVLGESGVGDPDRAVFGLSRLDEVNAPPDVKALLRNALIDLDTLSVAARKKNLTGPLEKVGRALGIAGAATAGGLAGGPGGAVAGALAGSIATPGGGPLAVRAGGAIGRKADELFGLRQPAVVLARAKALRGLADKGIDPGNTFEDIRSLQKLVSDQEVGTRRQLGLDTSPEAMSREAVQQAQARSRAGVEIGDDILKRMLPADQDRFYRWRDEQDVLAEAKAASKARSAREKMDAEAARKEADLADAMAKPGGFPTEDAFAAAEAEKARQLGMANNLLKGRDARLFAKAEREGLVKPNPAALDAVTASQIKAAAPLIAKLNGVEKAKAPARRRTPRKTPAPEAPAQTPVETPPAAPPVPPVQEAPSPAGRPAQEPPPAPAGGAGYEPPSWMAAAANYARQDFGVPVTVWDIQSALEDMAARGDIAADVAEAIRKPGSAAPKEVFNKLKFRAATGYGRPAGLGGFDAPNDGDRPVRNLYQFQSAAGSYQTAVSRAVDALAGAGDFEAAELAGTFGTATETDLPRNVRKARVMALISSAKDEATRSRRKTYLNPLLREEKD